jgi:hypothetical protein
MKIGGLTVSHHAAFCHLMPGIKKHGWIYILLVNWMAWSRFPVTGSLNTQRQCAHAKWFWSWCDRSLRFDHSTTMLHCVTDARDQTAWLDSHMVG